MCFDLWVKNFFDSTSVVLHEKRIPEIRSNENTAFESLKNDASVLGMVSAGSTGAVLTGGFLKVGRIKGVSRPALAPVLPTLKGTPVILIDSGANITLVAKYLGHSKIDETLNTYSHMYQNRLENIVQIIEVQK